MFGVLCEELACSKSGGGDVYMPQYHPLAEKNADWYVLH